MTALWMLVQTVWFVGRKIYRWRKGYQLTRGMTNETSPLFWKSWSFWLMILTAILGAAEVALPLFTSVLRLKRSLSHQC